MINKLQKLMYKMKMNTQNYNLEKKNGEGTH